ncbi:MAG: glutathione S-transferase family protein [Alphaproteobacteria bacterium]|nr:glutathione S-transferase family protein [Alphaproteobacteria bacterium]MBU1526535.1 glutathione S-transferase family protein [Alphaproteobacteria bacterium]MBU2118537.1 glutathione S-transferase family protein [Alphaproteobacteria bacterium]MBU2350098.1 glutathione S-transferase family protein [Alphaproteobacteria bacterium]MBU2383327.1 glutathione S-transferase family protein [Alphaproteobacteria bacterium]
MLTLFHASQSRSGRIVWLLEELRATYAIEHVDIFRATTGTGRADPANLHPDGKVPALMHDGALITESAAIALYLTDLFPAADLGAPVGSPERGAYLTWLAWTAGEMEPAYWGRIEGRTGTDPAARRRYDRVNARILGALRHGPYLMGHRFTAVDVMVGAALAWGLEHAPKDSLLDAYVARVAARPANARAGAKDAPEAAAA